MGRIATRAALRLEQDSGPRFVIPEDYSFAQRARKTRLLLALGTAALVLNAGVIWIAHLTNTGVSLSIPKAHAATIEHTIEPSRASTVETSRAIVAPASSLQRHSHEQRADRRVRKASLVLRAIQGIRRGLQTLTAIPPGVHRDDTSTEVHAPIIDAHTQRAPGIGAGVHIAIQACIAPTGVVDPPENRDSLAHAPIQKFVELHELEHSQDARIPQR